MRKRSILVKRPLLRCLAALVGFPGRDSPPEQTGPDGEDAVMEDCTESHQSEINGKIKAKGKLRNVLTYMPDERRALIYGDSSQSKMQSLDDEKTALLAVKKSTPSFAMSA